MRLEVIDFNNLEKIFDRNLTEEEIAKLNEVLLSNKFNNIDRRYIIHIANFLKENTYIDNKLEINFLTNFLNFILNEEVEDAKFYPLEDALKVMKPTSLAYYFMKEYLKKRG